MGAVPVDFLLRVFAVAVNGEVGLVVMSEVALVVGAKSGDGSVLGDRAGVRNGHADGKNRVLDNVEVLEGRGDAILGSEGEMSVGTGVEDQNLLVAFLTAEVKVLLGWTG